MMSLKLKMILASQSPYRRQQLEQLGCQFQVIPAHLDEIEIGKGQDLSPAERALLLGQEKAKKVRREVADSSVLIIASDQLVALDDEILGKPGNFEANVRQLHHLQGRSHDLFTSLVLDHNGQQRCHVDHTRLQMRRLSVEQIECYVRQDEPFDCAGGYKLERAGVTLFQQIESQDFSAIQGLPLMALTELFIQSGFPLPFQLKGSDQ